MKIANFFFLSFKFFFPLVNPLKINFLLLTTFLFIFSFFQIFKDHYHFQHNSVTKRSINPSHHHQGRLEGDDRVRWAKQQRAKSRQKRDLIRIRPARTSNNIVQLNDPKWGQMWYLVSFALLHLIKLLLYTQNCILGWINFIYYIMVYSVGKDMGCFYYTQWCC